MKVIIADDEIHICSLLRHVIDWNGLGITLMGVFNDGQSVLSQITKEPADIVICDIEMPGMNGIELIEQVKRITPNCQFVIISGFRNFEYAQSAMQYGVTHYLLKPIDDAELNRVLRAVVDKSHQSNDIHNLLRENSARQEFFNLLQTNASVANTEYVNKSYSYHFKVGKYNLIKVIFTNVDVNSNVLPQLVKMFRERLRSKIEIFCVDVELYTVSPVSVYALINYPYPLQKGVSMNSLLDDIFHSILVELGGLTQSRCYIGVGVTVDDISGIRDSLESAERIVNRRFLSPEKRTFYADFVQENSDHKTSIRFEMEDRHHMLQIMESILPEQAARWVNELFRKNEKGFTQQPHLIRSFFISVVDLLISAFDDLGVPINDKAAFRNNSTIVFDNSASLEAVKHNLAGIISREIIRRLVDKQLNATAYVQQIKNYIQKNYARKITLEIIAEELHVSPVYLSITFKNATGMNYSRYLTLVRMDKAKELLKRCDLNLTQIAHAVGYDSTNYFTNLFYKVTGLKASEYRRLHQQDIGD